ncbi:MAG TPA: ATP-binding protein [Anaerolineales bacterium]|nr:ATP-binding protein [Anaerolineales bacterium]
MRRPTTPSKSYLLHPLVALVAIGAATAVLAWLRGSLTTATVAILYLLPVGLSTALWGLGPGVVAAVAAFLALNFFFIEPYYTLTVHHTQDLLVLIVFLIVAGVLNQLVGRAQLGQALATANEREATRLYELSAGLAALNDEDSILRLLGEQALRALEADQVEVQRAGARDGEGRWRLPEGPSPKEGPPDAVAPVQSSKGRLGEIRLWRAAGPLTEAQARLLRTYAGQGALALDRARLREAETRAKVSEESDRLKSALLSSVSHELRSPLATIKAAVTSLSHEEVSWNSEARRDLLAAVEEETDHLNRLVGNLLDMSRIEAGALKPDRKWNALREIVEGVVRRMGAAFADHRLEVDVPDELPLVAVDYLQMDQVFTNLLSNCLKYAPPGTAVAVRAHPLADGWLDVEVTNQGPPVPAEHIERIFDKFYRVTNAERVTGTGLGLSICRGIIEAHGGRIWAENRPGGFAFRFRLPTTFEGHLPPAPLEAEAE